MKRFEDKFCIKKQTSSIIDNKKAKIDKKFNKKGFQNSVFFMDPLSKEFFKLSLKEAAHKIIIE